MVRTGIVGATGYAGEVLLDILLKHLGVKITCLYADIEESRAISEIFPKFKNKCELFCKRLDIKELLKNCDLIFLALPHTVSMQIAPKLLSARKTIIDLSADYRLKDAKIYQQFYKTKHKDKTNLKAAIYGLPEIYRQKIKGARLIANPGCYPTAAILGLAPLALSDKVDLDSIIIDAKSGVSGAGRKMAYEFLFSEVNGDFRAYKVDSHQHAPEINQELSKLAAQKIKITFVPHLLPVNRGILATMYVQKTRRAQLTTENLISLYKRFYKNEPFVRIKKEGSFPQLKDVVGTNFCDISIKVAGGAIIIIAAIDNLLKGASGQAVQNMNIIYKFPETMALS